MCQHSGRQQEAQAFLQPRRRAGLCLLHYCYRNPLPLSQHAMLQSQYHLWVVTLTRGAAQVLAARADQDYLLDRPPPLRFIRSCSSISGHRSDSSQCADPVGEG